ncbi:MAG: ThuA domain-containing protein [Gemmatimonadetes bacterium]|jgi:type 1 glutamine amidotransferase|nr:ThuA domain-containing protein [Gemmatimonadota bacterium]MDE0963817.1 ThuA domain-containing protein [Candidatus Latescibacterota bacterium]MBT5327105.1 ThuA domain-containing protein [Gemmatimonadota bacterium]MBT5449515.1 ThuA domain-containing protein [Gemmatimonadota bacterium]MBT5802398.1 ThuA domain-containing protein [Gemmatimonadota bacterium]|tara:strand:- start:574 stop:1197 length:624 start_codon:yes stop_codon:yes gene_type:complete
MAKLKTLVFGGGEIHDWAGIQPKLVETLTAADAFDLDTVQEDLDALKDLSAYDVLVFHYTVGEISNEQRDGLSKWLAGGKGFVGIHSAADSFRGDPDFRNLVGGHFITHPRHREYQVSVKDAEHPIMADIDEEFMVVDEQYITDYDPRVHVLASALWKGDAMPVAWTKSHGEGRVFYQALGHDPQACEHAMFKKMLVQGALWAAGGE